MCHQIGAFEHSVLGIRFNMKQPLLYTALIAGAFAIFHLTPASFSGANSEASYSPRVEAEQSAEGMHEIMRALRADIETGEYNREGMLALESEVRHHVAGQEVSRSSSQALYWNAMGPDNIGGRTRAIVAVTENLLYTGGVSGGLYKSTNSGNNWNRVSSFPAAMVASIGLAENGDLYVGTGSHYDGGSGSGGSGFRGRGVYWSTDGENWTLIEETDPGAFSGASWSACDALVGDPNHASRVWWGADAGIGYFENGQIFEDVFEEDLPAGYWVSDITLAADGSWMMLAAGNGRVYRTTDFQNLELISGGGSNSTLLPQSGLGRARVRISQTDPSSAFALFATSGGGFGGLFYSNTGGAAWTNIWPSGVEGTTPLPRNQGIYDLALGIGPDNVAYVGGIELWRCGPDYQAEQAAVAFDFLGVDIDVHADIHEIMFTPAGTMFVACDGGIYRSYDGDAYDECNRGFQVTQFYGIAHGPNTAVLGGTQDNGSLLIPANGFLINDQDAIDVKGGDGFDCALSQATALDGLAYFATSQNGSLGRGLLSESSEFYFAQDFFDGCVYEFIEEGEIGGFYTCMNLYENFDDPQSGQYVTLVNPYTETVEDSTFSMETANLNLPFEYTIEAPLQYWDMLVRPEITSETQLFDNEYWWLDPQDETLSIDCEDETVVVDGDTTYVTLCDSTWLYAADTTYEVAERLKVTDPYTSMTVAAFNSGNGVWMTRSGLNFNTQPRWFFLGNAPGGSGAKSIEFAVGPEPEAGNHIFVSGWDSKLYRFSGLDDVYEWTDCTVPEAITRTTILSVGSVITGVAVDPNNPNHVVATLGGYGINAGGKIQETFDALSDDPSWSDVWFPGSNELAKMPIYDAIIDAGDATGQTIVIGTEYGVWLTTDGGDNWTMENLGMAPGAEAIAVPVFSMEQQWRTATTWSEPSNGGAIYAGTHGRGIFRSDNFLSTPAQVQVPMAPKTLRVYPNPASGQDATLELTGWNTPMVSVHDMQGREVYSVSAVTQGVERVQLSTADLARGTYLVVVTEGARREATRLVIQ